MPVGTWPIDGGRKIARNTVEKKKKNGLPVLGLENGLAW